MTILSYLLQALPIPLASQVMFVCLSQVTVYRVPLHAPHKVTTLSAQPEFQHQLNAFFRNTLNKNTVISDVFSSQAFVYSIYSPASAKHHHSHLYLSKLAPFADNNNNNIKS